VTAGTASFDDGPEAPASAIQCPYSVQVTDASFGGGQTRLSGEAGTLPSDEDPLMDTIGARHLAARLRARVSVGTTIVLDCDASESGLLAGDRGVVEQITPEGVVVEWERGFSLEIDPERMPYHALRAA
jgi:hypothetical protein